MLNISRNVLLLRNTKILLKRYNLSQAAANIRNKQSMVTSKNQHTTDDDDDYNDKPIKFSESKAAHMRIEEYRNPLGYITPWYQPHIVSLCLAVFLIYFCILREENDIDRILEQDLETQLSKAAKAAAERNAAKVASNK